ncbi:hypothetical protein [Mucilaginibacter ginsenosidivorax]|uniref:Class I SAM-dependent methyltransferase n=1 Tax=Mucilaginibacter ginsenosidivorax TaxID=862126 RepID=A0A5B8W2D2_9SPHI|nr:hypothetical protein [Mucilaginibacter ginsenosidivorax]QEC77931.1 hypothetical protein FSB76_19045 [Mucilaginibacter ginsenosidivorax]
MNLLKKIYRKIFNNNGPQANTVIKDWEAAGKPVPPPHIVKQGIIKALKDASQYELFVETGTYLGEMVVAQSNNFKKIYSIELGEDLYRDAVKKFEQQKHITILQGDSGNVLVKLAPTINEPAIFWLDGHYSAGITAKGDKDCPIYEELTAIFSSKPLDHILLIDDARLFVGQDDYPTIPELTAFIKQHRSSSIIEVADDIISVFLK